MIKASPTFSIVIELENARMTDAWRTREMLKQLHEQLVEVGQMQPEGHPQPKIFIPYDKNRIDPETIEKVFGEVSEIESWPANIQLIPTDGLEYYEQKNLGAQQSDADLIIFLDSDVSPEQGWLAGYLEAFQNPDVQVVRGNTYIMTEDLYSKALALAWVFPLRGEGFPNTENDLTQTDHFWANNVAFRRETFDALGGFPDMPSFRGQCVALAQNLKEQGVDIFLQQRSPVAHPAPSIRYFVNRAFCKGHDQVINHDLTVRRLRGKSPAHSLVTSSNFVTFSAWNLYGLGRALTRVARYHRDVRLGPIGAVAAAGIAASYYILRFTGAVITTVRPDFVRRYFPI